MAQTIMIIPVGVGAGSFSVMTGLARAFENHGVKVATLGYTQEDIEQRLGQNQKNELLEDVVAEHQKLTQEADIIIFRGLLATQRQPYASAINFDLCRALDAKVIIVASPSTYSMENIGAMISIVAHGFGGTKHSRVLGFIVNKVNAPLDASGRPSLNLVRLNGDELTSAPVFDKAALDVLCHHEFKLLAAIPWESHLASPRVKDIAKALKADCVIEGDLNRRIANVQMCARRVDHVLSSLKANTLIVTPYDRDDVIIAAAMAVMNGVNIPALLLTNSGKLSSKTQRFCEQAFEKGLTILAVKSNTYQTANAIAYYNPEVERDDDARQDEVKDYISSMLDQDWIDSFLERRYERHLSPAAFRFNLIQRAKAANKTIVLPEGTEPRTLRAANICEKRGIAHCVLLGDPKEVKRVAQAHGIELEKSLTIIHPKKRITKKYVKRLLELRAEKGVNELLAKQLLEDAVYLGTMMLEVGEVDGLVSGAEHTTANTIRPALQLIKTTGDTPLVSSVFFMCLPEQVLVYGDCAVNPDPNAEQLAAIAVQSAQSAKAFGIEPRIAMISYSTGESGQGTDVDKVRKATALVKKQHPELLIDGPLQYDAAMIASVAKSKAPNSPVAGRATVFIFPDLNTGNTTYKAVQRSANVLSIGPMLQGLRKPVNDLSRGALVDDIVYTIAITAVQAGV
jgi:phosphate acetyltransferase